MNKPKDFDTAKGYGDWEPLPAGGYICHVMQVQEARSNAGNDMIKIGLDIAEGPEKNRFTDQFRNDNRPEKKWPCIAYQLVYTTDGSNNTNPGFKSFITSVTESNGGFSVQWGDGFCGCFKGKLVGVIFQREQYKGSDDKLHWSSKPFSFRSVETIRSGKFQIPEDKPYKPGSNNGYTPPPQNTVPAINPNDFEEIIGDPADLPF